MGLLGFLFIILGILGGKFLGLGGFIFGFCILFGLNLILFIGNISCGFLIGFKILISGEFFLSWIFICRFLIIMILGGLLNFISYYLLLKIILWVGLLKVILCGLLLIRILIVLFIGIIWGMLFIIIFLGGSLKRMLCGIFLIII